MRTARVTFVAGALVAAAVLASVPTAVADGDPASDVLYTSDVFLPLGPPAGAPGAVLTQQVAAVYRGRQRIKVAVIASPVDLGAIPSLFRRPASYAKFLGLEIRTFYVGPVLVVMPNGFGVYDGGRSTKVDTRVLHTIRIAGPAADQLAAAASAAVEQLFRDRALRSPDVLAPTVEALPAIGRRGSVVQLRYFVIADSERASTSVRVVAGRNVVATLQTTERTVRTGKAYATLWLAPRSTASSGLKFCVTATSPSGERSRPSCAPVTLV